VDDCAAFASAVRALAEDPDQLNAMGRKARATAVTKFGLDRWTSEYVAAFRALARQESARCLPAVL
jgi:glycosyltransferase involved in cell wall biosynthesis